LAAVTGVDQGSLFSKADQINGGIGLIAGVSNLCPFPKYILFVGLAITPLPILFLLSTLPKLFAGREIDNLSILIYTVYM